MDTTTTFEAVSKRREKKGVFQSFIFDFAREANMLASSRTRVRLQTLLLVLLFVGGAKVTKTTANSIPSCTQALPGTVRPVLGAAAGEKGGENGPILTPGGLAVPASGAASISGPVTQPGIASSEAISDAADLWADGAHWRQREGEDYFGAGFPSLSALNASAQAALRQRWGAEAKLLRCNPATRKRSIIAEVFPGAGCAGVRAFVLDSPDFAVPCAFVGGSADARAWRDGLSDLAERRGEEVQAATDANDDPDSDSDPRRKILVYYAPLSAPRVDFPFSYSAALALSVFCGMCGIDRCYLGYWAIGILKCGTCGFFLVGIWIDIVFIATQWLGPADGTDYALWARGPLVVPSTSTELTAVLGGVNASAIPPARWPVIE
jgi:TM2 domain-containing membrane protein YozV